MALTQLIVAHNRHYKIVAEDAQLESKVRYRTIDCKLRLTYAILLAFSRAPIPQTNKGSEDFIPFRNSRFMIPADSNLNWLTLFLALPRELVSKRKVYLDLPRNVRKLLASEEAMKLVRDDSFLELVQDSYAWICWQFLLVPSPKGGYMSIPGIWDYCSGDFPLWKLSYQMVGYIREKFERDPLRCTQNLFMMGNADFPWTEYETFFDGIGRMTDDIVREKNLQPVFDTVWRNRQPEDYNGKNTKQHDFARSWHHDRNPESHTSLDHVGSEGMKVNGETVHEIPDTKTDEQEEVDTKDFFARFKETLSERDMKILELRMQNVSMADIAMQMGYSNAGAVSKRIAMIARALEQYRSDTIR